MFRIVWVALLSHFAIGSSIGQLTRVANTSLQMPQNPAQRGYALQQFGPTFSAPVALATPPGETNRLFIVEKGGRIRLIPNVTAATPTVVTFMDISSRLVSGGERGLLGLAFHPNYAQNGYFYVFYTAPNNRVSRFSVSTANRDAGNPNSEQIIIDQVDQASNHNGGDLHFGPDGYLYVALGDEGAANDSYQNSQRINKNFFAGIIRIDIDERPGNLAPNAHPAITGNYLVPADNPFVGATKFNGVTLPDPTKVRTEFWAVGLRNPWRMSFDPLTGTLWCGDVGQGAREEIDIIVKGGNYGWNYREGNLAFAGTPPAGFVRTDPVYDYPRGDGYSVTGGRVYRGGRISQIYGAYIFADYGAPGNVWALRLNSSGKGVVTRLLQNQGISGFGVDPSNGDILVCNHDQNRVLRLVYNAVSTGTPIPPTLADTGAFSDLASLTPQPGIIPYELNLPFWSDGAAKSRWLSVPKLADKMTFDATNTWLTPTGTVFIKHFEMEMTNGEPASVRRLETRFIVRNTNGVYGATYRWTDATTATLVPEEGMDETLEIHDGGATRTQVWHYPSRSECLACHNNAAGWVLGLNAPQLNRPATHGSLTTNQIAALSSAGYLSNPPAAPHSLLALAKPDDASASEEFRVRSYLAANCAHCHRPDGPSLGNFDARIGTATDLANLINGPLVNSGGNAENKALAPNSLEHSMILRRASVRGPAQMPPISSNIADPAAAQLLSTFIQQSLVTRQSFAQWQVARFNTPVPPEAAAAADPDLDGASNMLEFLTGTDPILDGDAWGILAGMGAQGPELRFENPANRAVVIEVAETISDRWTTLDHPSNQQFFPAAAGDRTITGLAQSEARFYRARVVQP